MRLNQANVKDKKTYFFTKYLKKTTSVFSFTKTPPSREVPQAELDQTGDILTAHKGYANRRAVILNSLAAKEQP